MSDVLARICADKRVALAERKAARPMAQLVNAAKAAPPPRGFAQALGQARAAGRYGLIAEIKKASPSKGVIRADFDPPTLAAAYREGGATCLSVLTDEPYFQGDTAHLIAARRAVDLPVLRKDFMLDPYQVVEARVIGADCILLIVAALSDAQAVELEQAAFEFGMDVLVEVHDARELDRALALETMLLGINNRDLKSLEVDINTAVKLAPMVPPDRLVVAESGLAGPADLKRLSGVGITSFLVGESLMRQADVAVATRALLSRQPLETAGSR